jgi:CheY-like chemotaxis protein
MAKILVVDDDAPLRRIIQRHLESGGHTVVEASNGKEGFVLFARERPDLVILDMFMPVMDGYETIRTIRAVDPSATIIATSGGGKYHLDVLEGLEALGVAATLPKPFEREHLLRTVTRLLAPPPAASP